MRLSLSFKQKTFPGTDFFLFSFDTKYNQLSLKLLSIEGNARRYMLMLINK